MRRQCLVLLGTTLCLGCAWAQAPPAPSSSSLLPSTDVSSPLPKIEPRVVREEPDTKQAATPVHLLPHFSTTIRMRDAVRSVVVGDPSLFWADHKDEDASLVIVHARTEQPAQTNLEITTISGQQAILLLISDPQSQSSVDFALHYDTLPPAPASGSFWRKESVLPHMLVAETVRVDSSVPKTEGQVPDGPAPSPMSLTGKPEGASVPKTETRLDQLLAEQQRAPLPVLYGQRPGSIKGEPHLQAGVSQVIDQGGTVLVLFSVVNPAAHAVALLPPQVQLGGQVKKKWTTAEQLPVVQSKLDRVRVGPGERANGFVLFERPSFKQSKESLFLQIADSSAVDQPALAPIGFGVSSQKGGSIYAGLSER